MMARIRSSSRQSGVRLRLRAWLQAPPERPARHGSCSPAAAPMRICPQARRAATRMTFAPNGLRDTTTPSRKDLVTMKAHTEYLTMNIPSKMAFENITPKVEEAVRKSGVQEGLVLVNT